MTALLSFPLALLLTTVLLPLCIRYAEVLGLMDSPAAQRKVHTTRIPRSGGLAIALGSLVASVYWMSLDPGLVPLFASLMVILISGLLDDLLDLTSAQKLAAQTLAAVVFLAAYGGFHQIPFFALDSAPLWLCCASTFVFLVGVTNAINLSDGLDGLAAGNSLLSLGMLALLAFQVGETDEVVLALALAGGLLGFLRFNTHPARLFMGDTGAQFLGFSAAALTVIILQQDTLPVSPVLPLLLFGLPILDTFTVMSARALRGRPILQADRTHLHHQFLRLGLKHYEVVALLYMLQAISVGLAYILRYQSDAALFAVYAGYCAAVLGFIVWARAAGWHAHYNGHAQPERRNLWLRQFTWYHEHTAKVLAAGAAVFLLGSALRSDHLSAAVGDLAISAAGLLTAAWIYFRDNPTFVCRLICFFSAIAVIYGSQFQAAPEPTLQVVGDAFVIGLGVALAFAIRMTRKTLFHLDNQDYLVLFIIAVVPFLPLPGLDGSQATRVALRLAVVLYACEYVASKGGGSRWVINGAGLASLALLGMHTGWT